MLDAESRAALARSHLGGLDEATLVRLTEGGMRLDVPAGGAIHHPDDGPVCGLVVSGLLRMYMESPGGRQVTLRYGRVGSLLGVATVFSEESIFLVQEALVPSRVYAMRTTTLRALAETDVAVALALLREVSDRAQTYIAIAGGDILASVRQRLIAHLLGMAQYRAGPEPGLVVEIGQQQLADAAGTVREVVVRILRDLREARLVRTGRNGIILLDPSGLEAELWPLGLVR